MPIAQQGNTIKRLKRIRADGSYRGDVMAWVEKTFGWKLDIVEKPREQSGFQVLPKRWIVERAFAWLVRQRRLALRSGEPSRASFGGGAASRAAHGR